MSGRSIGPIRTAAGGLAEGEVDVAFARLLSHILLQAVFMGADTMIAWPLYVALNSTISLLVTNIAQLATISLALAASGCAGGYWPLARKSRIALPRTSPSLPRSLAPNATSNG